MKEGGRRGRESKGRVEVQGPQVLGAGKGRKEILPWSTQKESVCLPLDFSPVKSISDF